MKHTQKILHVVEGRDIALCSYFLKRLLPKLNSQGVDVRLAIVNSLGQQVDFQSVAHPTEYFSGGVFSNISKIKAYIKEEGITAVHSHHVGAQGVAAWAAFLAGKKAINTVYAPVKRKCFSYLINLNAANVFISSYVLNKFLKFNFLSLKKTSVIYPGIEIDLKSEAEKLARAKEIKKNLGCSEESFLVSNFSRLEGENDQTSLIKAFKKLRQKEFDGYLLLSKEGSNRKNVEKVIADLEVQDRVKFLNTDEMAVLSMVDAYVDAGFHDNWRDHILKIMGLGRAVITTKIAAHPEIIEDGKDGYLVPCGFPERIESAIMRLKVNQALSEKIKQNAKSKVEEKFSLDQTVSQHLKLY